MTAESTTPRCGGWLADAAADWLASLGASKPSPHTLAAYRRDVDGVAAALSDVAGVDVAELTSAHLDTRLLRRAFSRYAETRAASTVRRAHAAWTNLCDHLVDDGTLPANPMGRVPKPAAPDRQPRGIAAADALDRLLAAAAARDPRARHPWPERDVALVAVLAAAGLRISEAVALDHGDVDASTPDAPMLRVRDGKGRRDRSVPVAAPLALVLASHRASAAARLGDDAVAGDAPLLTDHTGARLTRHQADYLLRRLYQRSGLGAAKPLGAAAHALRHAFATSALSHGATVVEVQALLGHASLETTRRYLDYTGDSLRDAVASHPAAAALARAASPAAARPSPSDHDSGLDRVDGPPEPR